MPIFRMVQMNALNKELKKLYLRLSNANSHGLTHQDMLDLYAPKVVHDFLYRATDIGYFYTYPEISLPRPGLMPPYSGPDVTLKGIMRNVKGKRYPAWPARPEIQPDADVEIVKKYLKWVVRQIGYNHGFGMLRAALAELNNICPNSDHMLYHFPSIRFIAKGEVSLGEGKKGKDIIYDFGRYFQKEVKRPPNVCPLPPHIGKALQKSAPLLAMASLIPSDYEEYDPEMEVVFDLQEKAEFMDELIEEGRPRLAYHPFYRAEM